MRFILNLVGNNRYVLAIPSSKISRRYRNQLVFRSLLRLTFGLKHLAGPRLTAELSRFTGALSTCPRSRSAVTWTTSSTCNGLTLAAHADGYNIGTQRTCSCTTKRFTCVCSGSCTAHGITATLKHDKISERSLEI